MDYQKLTDKLVSWVRDKVEAAGGKGAVLGLSGGLDSSVAAVLSHRTFPEDTLALVIPCHSSKEDIEHANLLASRFSIPTQTVALDQTYDTLLKVLPDDKDSQASRLAQANLKARLRMLSLYYFANRLNYLVVGSSNRDELTLGYFTKYGDGGVDIQPLGSLLKGQVRELAEFLGIPQAIIDKPASAGLWEGQTDEEELGLSYYQIDRYLASGKASALVKKRLETMIASSQHKRQSPPVAEL